MEELFVEFLTKYGLILAGIALLGVMILSILKEANAFSKLSKGVRHILYLAISVGLSLIGSIIYLACIHKLTFVYCVSLLLALFGLNQAWYAIISNTPLKEWGKKLFACIKAWIFKGKEVFIDENIEAAEGEFDKKSEAEQIEDIKESIPDVVDDIKEIVEEVKEDRKSKKEDKATK